MASRNDTSLEEIFNAAAEYLPTVVSTLKQDQLLEFYALYKQATIGRCNTSKPSWYAVEAKRKWEAWNQLGSMPKEEAMAKYVKLLSETCPEWESSKATNPNGWVSVSCLASTDKILEEEEKTIFDRVKEGDIEQVQLFAEGNSIHLVDEEGMGLIHWASDRGNIAMVKCLLDLKADVNMRDSMEQTPLHYACSCGHHEVVELLLKNGANPNLVCSEGLLPLDVSSETSIQLLLKPM